MTNLFVLDNFLVPLPLYKGACNPGIFAPTEVLEVRLKLVPTLGRTERLRHEESERSRNLLLTIVSQAAFPQTFASCDTDDTGHHLANYSGNTGGRFLSTSFLLCKGITLSHKLHSHVNSNGFRVEIC